MTPEPWLDARGRLENANLRYPIEWPNEPFTVPNMSPWLSVDTSSDILSPIEMGGDGAWAEKGTFIITVLVPAGTGTLDVRTIAKTLANIYRGVTGHTVYRSMSVGEGIPSDDGKWWVTVVTITWEYTDRVVS